MSSYDTPTKRRPLPSLRARGGRGPRWAVVAAGTVVASALLLAGCTSAKSTASPTSSAIASAAVSSGASAPASSAAAASSAFTSPTPFESSSAAVASPVSSAAAAASSPIANIEAPATKAGFQIRVHRGSILKVDVPQAKAGTPVTYTLIPASAQFITPLAGANGFFTASSDGVVNVSAAQGGAAIGTLSVTVWG